MKYTNYRTDIDGLRAISILFVLAYHGGLKLFPSGFIGVDIFFVISGYLITGIISQALNNQSFSLIDFYNRRLWRLQPIGICLIFITLLLSLVFYLPNDLMDTYHAARKTSLFISNIFFNNISTQYFAPDTNLLPLLHTWSLSIEWQCYLMLPIILSVLHKTLGPSGLKITIYILTVGFCCLSFYLSMKMPDQVYYQFSSRIFEFLIGASIALTNLKRFSCPKLLLNILGLSALFCLFYIAKQSHVMQGYPNYYALWVCMASAVLLVLKELHPKHMLLPILTAKPLMFIGLLSYSLYIWHWLVFSFIRYLNIEESSIVLFIVYIVIFAIAYLSWRFIEKPTRQLSRLNFRYAFIGLLLIPVIVIHVSAYIIKSHHGYPQRFANAHINEEQLINYRAQAVKQYTCANTVKSEDATANTIPINKTGLLIGDSYAGNYYEMINVLGDAAHLSVTSGALGACMMLPYLHTNKTNPLCSQKTKQNFNLIRANHYDYVIMAQRWPAYLHVKKQDLLQREQRLQMALEKALNIIITSGATPVLLKPFAMPNKKSYVCFERGLKRHHAIDLVNKQCQFKINADLNRNPSMDKLFKKLSRKYPTLIILDPRKAQCPNGHCPLAFNGAPIYFPDDAHIHNHASFQLGQLYLQKYKNPFC